MRPMKRLVRRDQLVGAGDDEDCQRRQGNAKPDPDCAAAFQDESADQEDHKPNIESDF